MVGFHYYIWNESEVGDIILGWGLEILPLHFVQGQNDRSEGFRVLAHHNEEHKRAQ